MDRLPRDIQSVSAAQLEQAYRLDPVQFRSWFDTVYQQNPQSQLLQAWQARLGFDKTAQNPYTQNKALGDASRSNNSLLLYVVFISVLVWAIAKLPDFIATDAQWFYPRFIPFLVISALVIYFSISRALEKVYLLLSIGGLTLVLLVLLLLPDRPDSNSITMALIHSPFVILSLLGMAFCGGHWRDSSARLQYIRYGGELLIFTALILLGGGVLTALSLGLFDLIGIPIDEWFFDYIVMWGVMSAPLIATWLWDQVLNRESKLASVIANVFSPLFLLLTVAYLFALLGQQRSLFSDREFLIIFNALLLVVWGITVFSVSGREEKGARLLDITNLSLVFVTLVIDAIALTAIVYRLLQFGITPNRIAVTGANLLIFVHLLWIFYEYVKAFQSKSSTEMIKTTIGRYLPVYSVWSIFVLTGLPLLFGFS
jgi:hypothetical protein